MGNIIVGAVVSFKPKAVQQFYNKSRSQKQIQNRNWQIQKQNRYRTDTETDTELLVQPALFLLLPECPYDSL